ncbi:MAG: hypothetical protein C4305_08310, partial [Thermoleophilia bacterium]
MQLLTRLYVRQALAANEEGRTAPAYVVPELESATGDRLYYAGVPLFPGQSSGLRRLPPGLIDWDAVRQGRTLTFEFTPPGEHRPLLAVGHPLHIEGTTLGVLAVAKPKTVLRDTWLTLMKFFAVSFAGGLLVAGM